MTNQINFQQAEIDELMALLEAVKDVPDTTPGKYRDLYAFVHSIIETSSLVDGRTKLFFRLATIINNDEPASANLYIRTVTSLGLQHDGLLPSDPIEAENLIQRTSNIIGEAIFAHLVDVQGIPSLASIIQSDVTISIQDGGQTWGGWGGSFILSFRACWARK